MAGLGAIRGSQGTRRGLGTLHPEVIYRANGGRVQSYADGGNVTGTYGQGPELLFFPLNSPVPGVPGADDAEPGSEAEAPGRYSDSSQTSYQPPSAGGMDANQGPTPDGAQGSLGGLVGGGNMGRIGGIAGAAAGLAGVPFGGVIGRGIGSAIDTVAADGRLGRASDLLGSTATGPLGVGRMGLGAWGSDVIHGLTFGRFGTDVNDREGRNLSDAVQSATPAQLEAINRNDPAYQALQAQQAMDAYSYNGPDYGWSPGTDYMGSADSGTVGLAHGGPVGIGYAHAGPVRAAPSPAAQMGVIKGPGSGQSDEIDARLSDNEHVLDAEVVAAIGDGSSDEGHRRLEAMKRNLRKEKRSAPAGKIPPKTKALGSYMKGGK